MAEEVGSLRVKLGLDNAQFDRSVASLNKQLQMVGQEFRTLQNKGKDWGNSLEGLRSKQTKLTEMFTVQQEKVKRLSAAYEKAKAEQGEYSVEAQKLGTQLARAQAEMQRTETELGQISAELKRQEAELARSQTSWAKFGEAAQQAGEKLKAVGDKMTSIGKELSMKITTPLVGLGVAATKVGSDFEAGMSKVAAISGATGTDLQALQDKAREMGATTKFSATESAEALTYMAMAGWKTNQMLTGIEGIMNLAAASGEGLALVSDIVTDALTAFGMKAEESGRFADVLAAASSNANTNVAMLGESFKYVAPVAGALKFSAEDTALALGLMANAGIKASNSGTALRSIMTNLTETSVPVAKEMEKLGLSLTDSEGNMKSFRTVMDELRETYRKMTPDMQANSAAQLFGKEAMAGALAIINASEEDYNKLASAIDNSAGSAEKMAKTMNDNLQGRIKEMQSALEEAGIAIYNSIQPALEILVASIKQLADWFNTLSPTMINFVVIAGGIAAAIGPVIVVLGILLSSIGTITSTFGALSIAISHAGGLLGVLQMALTALTGPVAIAIAAIVGIGVAMVAAYKHFEGFRNVVDNVLNAALGIIQNVMTTIKNFILNIWGQITQFWQQNGEQIKQATSNVWTAIKAVIDAVMPAIKLVIDVAMKAIKLVVEQIWDAIKGTIQGVLNVILGLIKTFSSLFTGDWKGLWEGVKQFLSGAVQAIWNIAQLMFFGKLLSGLKTFVTSFSGLFTSMWTAIKNLFTSSTGTISKVTTTAFNAIKNVVNMSMNTVKTIVTTVWNVIKNIFTTTVNAIKSVVTNGFNIILSTIKHIMTSVVNAVKGAATHMFSAGKDLVQGLINGIKDMSVAAIEAITGLVDGVITKAKNLLGIKSPSRVFAQIGKWTGEGLANGVTSTKKQNEKAIKDVTSVMTNAAKKNANEISKIADKAELERTKIQQSYSKKRSNMKKADGKKIAELEKEMHGKLSEINKKAWTNMVEKEKELNNQKLQAIKKFIDDKKKANELSLIDEAQYWRTAYQQFKTGSAENIELRQAYQENIKRINDAVTSVNNEHLTKAQKINDDLVKNEEDTNKKYTDALASRYQTILGYYGLFDAVTKGETVDKSTLSNNLKDQVDSLNDWSNQIEQLKRRKVSSGLIDELQQMGVKATEQLRALNTMTDVELSSYQKLYQEKMKVAKQQAVKELEPLQIETQNKIQAMRNAANAELEALNKEWQKAIKNVIGGTDKELKTLHQVGKNAGQGLLDGLKSMDGALQKQAETMAKTIKNTIQKSLDIHSPSRWMRDFVAGNLAKGFEIGVNDKLRNVMTAGQKLATAITSPVEVATIPTGGNFNSLYGSTLNNIASALNAQSNVSMPSTIVVQSVLDGRVVAEVVTPFVSSNQYGNANVRAMTKGVKM